MKWRFTSISSNRRHFSNGSSKGGTPKGLWIALGSGFTSVAALLTYLYQRRRSQLKKLEMQCVPLVKDENYRSNYLRLVEYRGCVLNKDSVTSGTMDKIRKFKVRPTDVFVSSFPKSGTTWLQEVVYRLYIVSASSGNHQQLRELVDRCDEPMDSRFPYLEFPYPGLDDIDRREGVRLIKTHLPVHLLPQDVGKAKAVLYIYRNPKDTVVSYYHFMRTLTYTSYSGNISEFVDSFINGQTPYSPYFPHLKGYFDYFNSCEDTNVSKSNMLITSFEEMKKTPQKVIGDIARHLNIEVSQDDIEEIAKQTSFEVMKRNSRTNYEHWDQLGITHKNSEKFYRKGQVGSFNDDLSHHDNAHLNKWIESQRWIPSFQYSVHGQSSNNNEQK